MSEVTNQEQYEAAAADREKEYLRVMAEQEQKARDYLRRSAEAEVRVALLTCGEVVPGAIDDLVRQLAPDVVLVPEENRSYVRGADGRPMRKPDDPRAIATVADHVRAYVRARPWYLRGDPSSHGQAAGGGSSGSTGKGSWDFQRALKDSAYNADWKINDPEGHAKAWADHLAKLDADLRRSNFK